MRILVAALGICCSLVGCATPSPAVSKSSVGNLEVNVRTADGKEAPNAELHVDGALIGNVSARLPVIHLKRGERTVRVECPGYKTYERRLRILGEPNHQVLNVILEKE